MQTNSNLLYDREPKSSMTPVPTAVIIKCTFGVKNRGEAFNVTFAVDDVRCSSTRRPCNSGACQNRSCEAFGNWSAEEVLAAFH